MVAGAAAKRAGKLGGSKLGHAGHGVKISIWMGVWLGQRVCAICPRPWVPTLAPLKIERGWQGVLTDRYLLCKPGSLSLILGTHGGKKRAEF